VSVAITLGLLAVAIGTAVVCVGRGRAVPDRVETVGPFEIVTHTVGYMAGWNEGRVRSATTENYSLRYRGEPFTFVGRAGRVADTTARYETLNAVITFSTSEPALVVNVGDPNNRSFFYLVREAAGRAVAEYLAEVSGGVSASYLDPAPQDSANVRDIAAHRARLSAGRWLLLGDYCVLDTRTLTRYPIEPLAGPSLNQFKPPIAMSPDERSFVRFGYSEFPENAPLLVVFDFVGGTSYTLPIDRRIMRYIDWEEIDAPWLDHHFEWHPVEGGHDRLAQRANVRPLPYHGRLSVDPHDGFREYNVLPVKPAMGDTLVAFLEREFAGQRLPPPPYSSSVDLRIGDRVVHVLFHQDNASEPYAGLWEDRGMDGRVVEDIAKRFDGALRTGEFDGLFLP
jgi:hypothetical protein